MQLGNSQAQYGAGAKFFHWLLFVLLATMIPFGIYLEGMEFSPQKLQLIGLHKSFGVTILVLVSLRLTWRIFNPPPPLPDHLPQWQKRASHAVHGVLYFAMFAIPISGWMYSSVAGFPVSVFGLFTLPDLLPANEERVELFHSIHGFFGDVLIAAFVIHVAAALNHHFREKDTILLRMLPFTRVDR